MPMLTIKEAAAELLMSQQWLAYWLAEHPVDAAGVPFYVPMGRRKRFEAQDIDRIRAHLRDLEAARLGPRVQSGAKLVGLLSHLGDYQTLLKMREKEARRRLRRPRHKT